MSSSQFDDLLGDFGDSSNTSATTKASSGANGGLDEFDPFGPSDTTANGGVEVSAGNSELLLDFSAGAEVENGNVTVTTNQSANPLYDEFTEQPAATDSANPLYDEFASEPATNQSEDLLSGFSEEQQTQQQPTNPLYDESAAEEPASTTEAADPSANPLYDDTTSEEPESSTEAASSSANPLYDLTAAEPSQAANPLYEEYPEEAEEKPSQEEPAVDMSAGQEDEAGQQIHIEEMEPQIMNGDPKAWFGEQYLEQEQEDIEAEAEAAQEQEEQAEEEDHPEIPIVEVTASPGTGGGRDEVEALEEKEEEEAAKALAAEQAAEEETQGNVAEEEEVEQDQEVEQQPLPDLVVREPGDQEDDGAKDEDEQEEEQALEDVGGAGAELYGQVAEDAQEPDSYQQQQQQQDDHHHLSISGDPHHHYGHDRREEDLEQYCLDREDSDLPEEFAVTSPVVSNQPDLQEDDFKGTQAVNTVSDASLETKVTQPEEHTSNKREESEDKGNVSRQESNTVQEPTSPAVKSPTHTKMDDRDARVGLDVDDDDEEEGVYENEPERRDDVVREADKDTSVDLPAAGTASNMKARFLQGVESAISPSPRSKREITPPAHGTGGEYVSEPRTVLERYEAKPDAGVFESPEPTRNPEVVSSYEMAEEARPEQGYTRNVAARFKDLEAQSSSPSSAPRREITPPNRDGPAEYVSEPRGPSIEQYDVKVDAGVFESEPQVNPDVVQSGEAAEEALPERGTARNMASRYLQLTEESKSPPAAKTPKEIVVTSEADTRVEYESEPQRNPDVVTSDTQVEEFVPQRGFTKNIASRFKELESTAKSPPVSPGRHKEFTPPREQDNPTVKESMPAEQNPDVVHSGDMVEEALPEKGTARNMMQRFKQLEAESKSPTGSSRAKKEFTPPPGDAGVYENTPKQFQADYNRPAESGIVENQPTQREDVVRGNEPPKYEEELPERGAAKNLVSKWRQLESESAKVKSPGSRPKEFTPPREEPRRTYTKSPRTPMSPGGENGSMDNGCVHPSELPGQYQPQQGESVVESTPDERPADVLREGERDYAADLPKKNTAKKMLARFQSFQEKVNKGAGDPGAERQDSQSSIESEPEPEPEPAMESARQVFEDPAQIGRSKSMRAAIQVEKCGSCEKSVYAMERLEMNKTVYHKACFRCSQCKSVLTPKTFAINNGVIFCTNHYKQLFATKGNYDEGFGRMQHKKRWNSNPNLAADGEDSSSNNSSSHNGHHQQHTVAAANS